MKDLSSLGDKGGLQEENLNSSLSQTLVPLLVSSSRSLTLFLVLPLILSIVMSLNNTSLPPFLSLRYSSIGSVTFERDSRVGQEQKMKPSPCFQKLALYSRFGPSSIVGSPSLQVSNVVYCFVPIGGGALPKHLGFWWFLFGF